MSIVFAYVPSLTYPDVIFNVDGNSTIGYGFNVRCDYASNTQSLDAILQECASTGWITQPVCGTSVTWLTRPFSFGRTMCSTNYLSSITATRDTSVSWIGLAVAMMSIGVLLFGVPTVCVVAMFCTDRIPGF